MSQLDPQDLSHIGGTSWQADVAKDLILAGWENRSVVLSEYDLPGTATVNTYSVEHVVVDGHVTLAGTQLSFKYETTDSIYPDLHYVQVIWTNYPTGGVSPYLDRQDVEFYYYSEGQESNTHDEDGYFYFDRAMRSYDGTNAIQ